MELTLTPREETRLNSKSRAHYFSKGLVPAAVHGRSIDPGPCFVSTKHSRGWHRGSMFDVSWNGKNYKASIDELQYEPVSHKLVHISFHLVGKNEVTHIDIPVKTVGSAPGEKEGGMVSLHIESITLEGKPDDFPEYIEVDVSTLHVGEKVTVANLTPPPGCIWYHQDEGQTVATCAHIKTQPVEEEAVAPAAEAPAPEDKEAA
ncbi:MAG: 50S ribosomal protein L25 [Bacteriovoracaceae bacterium]|nr:50S ribosomal protein L25 [Bacteriovoracaceae bacterium]